MAVLKLFSNHLPEVKITGFSPIFRFLCKVGKAQIFRCYSHLNNKLFQWSYAIKNSFKTLKCFAKVPSGLVENPWVRYSLKKWREWSEVFVKYRIQDVWHVYSTCNMLACTCNMLASFLADVHASLCKTCLHASKIAFMHVYLRVYRHAKAYTCSCACQGGGGVQS